MVQELAALVRLQPLSVHYILLKPEGHVPAVCSYLEEQLQERRVSVLLAFPVRFTKGEALKLYPKDRSWKIIYGEKRINLICSQNSARLGTFCSAESTGDKILDEMAEYLASGTCYLYVVQAFGAEQVCKELVGATDPAKAAETSLRRRFSDDSLMQATLQERAVRNVAHTPDGEDVARELVLLSSLSGLPDDVRDLLAPLLGPIFPEYAREFGVRT